MEKQLECWKFRHQFGTVVTDEAPSTVAFVILRNKEALLISPSAASQLDIHKSKEHFCFRWLCSMHTSDRRLHE